MHRKFCAIHPRGGDSQPSRPGSLHRLSIEDIATAKLVCDNAAKEVCPIWPGQPLTAHWGVPDPAAVEGSMAQVERAFREAFVTLDRRIGLFLSLPMKSLDALALKKEIDRIGHE